MIRHVFLSLVCICFYITAHAQTSLPSFFSDHMVLQQHSDAAVWGKDDPNTQVTVKGSWGAEATTRANKDGHWKVNLTTPNAGGPFQVTITGSSEIVLEDVLIGEVWLCSGQSNMEMPVKGFFNQPITHSNEYILHAENNQIRLFTVQRDASLEPEEDFTGNWNHASPSTVKEFSATAYFFGKKIQEFLDVPVGLIHSSWGGSIAEAWMDEKTLEDFPSIQIPDSLNKEVGYNHQATVLYNAMLHPLIGYAIKGVIWYQGESNRNRAEQYKTLFPALIQSWRDQWNMGSFPFYFVQIAPYSYEGNDFAGSAFLREAQLYAMQHTENTGMAVTMDIGDCDCIHPADKSEVGDRLAYWALSRDYHVPGIEFSGPVYREMESLEDGKIKLYFDYTAEGLTFFNSEPSGFEIAGQNKVFFPAQVTINRDHSLTVWSEVVPRPVSVRYAFKNCIGGTLYNTAGLPASSFRTDDWDQNDF